MALDPIKITLGGTEYQIRPFTLKYLKPIQIIVASQDGTEAGGVDVSFDVIAIALDRDYPEVAEAVRSRDLEAQVYEIADAGQAILRLAGFRKADQAGEASAL